VESESTPGTVGDYAASIGTTGFDTNSTSTLVGTQIVPVSLPPPNGAMVAFRGLSLDNGFPDGTTHTVMIGEKHIPPTWELMSPYDCNLYSGHNWECHTRSAGPAFPIASAPQDMRLVFGGPHPGVVQFVFADSGVRQVKKSVSAFVLGQLAHRSDGLAAPAEY
jgi:hypothetical protein